jgi:type I restriction enzyme S subunit
MSNSEPQFGILPIPNQAGWPLKTIDDLCSLVSRGSAPVYVENSEVLAIGQRCIANSGFVSDFARPHSERAMQNVLRPEKGDVLLNSTGTGTIGRSVVFNSPGEFIIDGHVTVLRSNPNVIDSRWLNSVLRTYWAQNYLECYCYSGSTNQLELSRTPLKSTKLPVPTEAEQGKIAQILDTLDTAIRETEAIIAKLKAVKQGLLHDLLTRGIDANGELRPPQSAAPHLYKRSPLGRIPKEWDVVKIGAETDIQHGFAFAGEHFSSEPLGPVLLVPGNFHRDGDLYFTDQNTKYYSGKYPENTILSNGDVLIVMTDLSPMTLILGKTVVLQEQFPVLHNQRIGKFLFKMPEHWDRAFFTLLMNDDRLRFKVIAEATGTTVRHTSPDRIKSGVIAKPRLDEQRVISLKVEALKHRLNTEISMLNKLKNQKSALMNDLLTGRVRVTPLLNPAAA